MTPACLLCNSHARPLGPPNGGDIVVKFATNIGSLDISGAAALRRPLEAVAFWSAVVLPFLYLPLLAYGLETTGQLATFFGLLIVNVLAFVIGHDYKR